MDVDWRNAFGILMCTEICDGAGAGICDDAPSTCSSFILFYYLFVCFLFFFFSLRKHAYSNILKILPSKNENFQIKKSDILYISAQNIECGYSLEPPR